MTASTVRFVKKIPDLTLNSILNVGMHNFNYSIFFFKIQNAPKERNILKTVLILNKLMFELGLKACIYNFKIII